MKSILMLSYYYPPLSNVGALRAYGFSKYLPAYGWKPRVLSVKNPDKAWCILGDGKPPKGVEVDYTISLANLTKVTGKINGLLARILSLFGVELTRSLITDLFCIPDQFIGWIPMTLVKALEIMKKERVDIIYVSCKPLSSAIIGAILKRKTGTPLVLDFRDPMTPLLKRIYGSYWKRLPSFRATEALERWCLGLADKVLFTTKETQEMYLTAFPFLRGKSDVIYNGFFEEEFRVQPQLKPFDKFTIIYTGNFYSEFLSPDPFFKGLRETLDSSPNLSRNIQFLYLGDKRHAWLQSMTKKYNLDDIVRLTGYVPRRKSIEYLLRSSMLLLRIVPGMISTKLYEGLAAGLPLLAMIEEDGEVATIIREYSNTQYYIVSPNESTQVSLAIADAYEKWARGHLRRSVNPKYFLDFGKTKLARRLSAILTELC